MHAHDHDRRLEGDRKLLVAALALIAALMVGEIVTGIVTGIVAGSLALLADAGHLVSDVLALGFAVVAATLAARPAVASGLELREHPVNDPCPSCVAKRPLQIWPDRRRSPREMVRSVRQFSAESDFAPGE